MNVNNGYRWFIGVVGGLVCAAWCPGTVVTQTWTLNQSNKFRDLYNYGSVKVEADSGTGVVTFTVDIDEDAYDILDADFGIDAFGFNYQNITSLPNTWTLSLPTASWTQTLYQKLSGYGWFQVKEDYGNDTRFDPLVFSITLPTASEAVIDNFTVEGTGAVEGGGDEYFAAHVAGFQMTGEATAGITDHWTAGKTPLPEPTTIIFSLAGLALLGWFKRRLG
jgi:hypothetical protein